MTLTLTENDFKVADLSLAEFGRKELTLAEHEMPGLMALREEYGDSQPLKGARITGSLHMTIQTGVLIETLVALGADVRWASCNIFSTQDHAAAAIVVGPNGTPDDPQGIPVFAWKGETLEEYWWCTEQCLKWEGESGPNMILDDGGDATLLVHKGVEYEAAGAGSVPDPSTTDNEELQVILEVLAAARSTTIHVLHADGRGHQGRHRGDDDRRPSPLPDAGGRRAPLPGDQRQRLGHEVEVRQPLRLPPLARRRHQPRRRRHALRQGRGRLRLRRRGQGLGRVAARPGRPRHRHRDRPDLRAPGPHGGLRGPHASRTSSRPPTSSSRRPATRTSSRPTTWRKMKHQAIVGNIGHFDNEIQVSDLEKRAERVNIKPQVDEYRFPDGHTIILLSEGRLLNLGNATGHPSFVMSNSFSNQTIAQIELFTKNDEYETKVYVLPKHLDEKVALVHVQALGATMTKLCDEQAAYIGVPVDGPYKSDHYRY